MRVTSCALPLSDAVAPARIGSVRTYATMLCTCAGDSSALGGIAVPGIPDCTTCASCTSLRSTCHATVPISGGSRVSDLASAPSPAPVTPWHEAQRCANSPSPSSCCACVARSDVTYATTFQRCSDVSVPA